MLLKDPVSKYPHINIWLFVAFVLTATGSLLGLHIISGYYIAINQLQERLLSQARVIDENLNPNIISIGLMIENITQELVEPPGSKSGGINEYLKKQQQLFNGVRTILILDSQGRCTHSNRDELIGQIFSHRDYFTAPRDAAQKDQLFISPPFKTVLNTFVSNISRPVVGKEGEFKGVIALSLSPEYLDRKSVV